MFQTSMNEVALVSGARRLMPTQWMRAAVWLTGEEEEAACGRVALEAVVSGFLSSATDLLQPLPPQIAARTMNKNRANCLMHIAGRLIQEMGRVRKANHEERRSVRSVGACGASERKEREERWSVL